MSSPVHALPGNSPVRPCVLRTLLATLLILTLAPAAQAQLRSEPQPAAAAPALPAPRDIAYPGVVTLDLDVSDTQRKIFRFRQTVPVSRAGDLVLHYAQWIPGNHAPRGPIYNFTGLTFSANGKPLVWRRDPADVFSFHVQIPSGVSMLEIEGQFVTPVETAHGPMMVTPEMMRLNWYVAALYPAGYYARRIPFDVTLTLPAGWDYATALETKSRTGDVVSFGRTDYETLIDSPLFAGKHVRKIDLDPGGRSRVTLNAVGDTMEEVSPTDAVIQLHRNLVIQADRLFGARHFNHYDFLLSISDKLATAGIEHARSSDNGVRTGYFTKWDAGPGRHDLLPHEYVHSWNGKYRRPAELWTPNFNTPMRGGLLWVYEGQTLYWGYVLAARSGMLTRDQAIEALAGVAATYDYRIGRTWRPVTDTTLDPILAARRALPWPTWQRSEDYYSEGLLIWLEADGLIREATKGKKSLDDFAKAFFGVNDGDWGQLTYTRDDVIRTLNSVHRYDWKTFFEQRVDAVAPDAPLKGFELGGYRLVYSPEPGPVMAESEKTARALNLTYSIGLAVADNGDVNAVQWDGPAFQAGMTAAARIEGVNGADFSLDRLKEAVRASTSSETPVVLKVRQDDATLTLTLNYTGGLRYPRLEPIPGAEPRLDAILMAK
jgi:predicted metalloprotease with PDZ domain